MNFLNAPHRCFNLFSATGNTDFVISLREGVSGSTLVKGKPETMAVLTPSSVPTDLQFPQISHHPSVIIYSRLSLQSWHRLIPRQPNMTKNMDISPLVWTETTSTNFNEHSVQI